MERERETDRYEAAGNKDSRGEVVDGQVERRTKRVKENRSRGVQVICCSLRSD